MQPPQREGRVAHPAVAVVPVALAARRLRQRRRCRRDGRARRRVRQSLQRQRRALQVLAPAVVGEAAGGEPAAPVVRCGLERASRRPRRRAARRARAPSRAQRTGARPRPACDAPGARLPSIPSRRSDRSLTLRAVGRLGRAPVGSEHLPRRRLAPVLENRLADDLDLHLALDALDVRTSMWSASSRSGGRVWSSRRRARRASRRSSARRARRASPRRHPGRLERSSSRARSARQRHHDAVRPHPEAPARRSSSAPNTLGESNRGTHIHSIDAVAARPARRCGSPTGTRSRDRREWGSARQRRVVGGIGIEGDIGKPI